MQTKSRLRFAVLLALATMVALPAFAAPPPHAPAHGWRAKHDPYYVGYTGRHWSDDYGTSGPAAVTEIAWVRRSVPWSAGPSARP